MEQESHPTIEGHSLAIDMVGAVVTPLMKSDAGYFFEFESKAPTDDDLATCGMPNSGTFKVLLLPMCVQQMEKTHLKVRSCIALGNHIRIWGTLKVIPDKKNEFSYTCKVYALRIEKMDSFGTIVEQPKEILNVALAKEVDRRREAVIRERESRREIEEKDARRQEELAKQHAERLKQQRARLAKAKVSKLGTTGTNFDDSGAEAMAEQFASARKEEQQNQRETVAGEPKKAETDEEYSMRYETNFKRGYCMEVNLRVFGQQSKEFFSQVIDTLKEQHEPSKLETYQGRNKTLYYIQFKDKEYMVDYIRGIANRSTYNLTNKKTGEVYNFEITRWNENREIPRNAASNRQPNRGSKRQPGQNFRQNQAANDFNGPRIKLLVEQTSRSKWMSLDFKEKAEVLAKLPEIPNKVQGRVIGSLIGIEFKTVIERNEFMRENQTLEAGDFIFRVDEWINMA